MRISKFQPKKVLCSELQLKSIDLTKKPLGAVIALIGKNGAGKSRILKLVKSYLGTLTKDEIVEKHISHIPKDIINKYRLSEELIAHIEDEYLDKNFGFYIEDTEKYITDINESAKSYIKVIDNTELSTIRKNLENNISVLEDSMDKKVNDTKGTKENQNIDEIKILNSEGNLKYFEGLANEILTHQSNFITGMTSLEKNTLESELCRNSSYLLFKKFRELVQLFLGQEFSYKQVLVKKQMGSELLLNGNTFQIERLSPGQKTLFAYALLFYCLEVSSKTNLKDSIIIIDEPELHLHPESQIQLIKALRSMISETGQLWIATHSVHILAHLNYDEVFMVHDSELTEPSRTTPGNSFKDLMGLEDHIVELSSFINSLSEWSFGNFISQCFNAPDVVFDSNPKDPQYLLFKSLLNVNVSIEILDYGAGMGRLGSILSEDSELNSKLKYSAYEIDPASLQALKELSNIQSLYSSKNDIDKGKFDFVLMCNVLHEITPTKWSEEFHTIKSALKKSGYLLILEDLELPKGECIDDFGYLILNPKDIDELFPKKSNSNRDILHLNSSKAKYSERLILAAVPAERLDINEHNIIEALKSLKKHSYSKLQKNREVKKVDSWDLSLGRKYANSLQLYINAQIALEKGFNIALKDQESE
jgi:predicted ATPase